MNSIPIIINPKIEGYDLNIPAYNILIYTYSLDKCLYKKYWIENNLNLKVYSKYLLKAINKLLELELVSLEKIDTRTYIKPSKDKSFVLLSSNLTLDTKLEPLELRILAHISSHGSLICKCKIKTLARSIHTYASRMSLCIDNLIEKQYIYRGDEASVSLNKPDSKSYKTILSLSLAKALKIPNLELNEVIRRKLKLDVKFFPHIYKSRRYSVCYLTYQDVETILNYKKLSIQTLPSTQKSFIHNELISPTLIA